VLNSGVVKLVRTVELPEITHEEVMGVLFPTLAFIEDHFGVRPARIVLCGMGEGTGLEEELGAPVEMLRSRFGTPNGFNAGLHGYLQGLSGGAGATSTAA
jgi:hypothetical protein